MITAAMFFLLFVAQSAQVEHNGDIGRFAGQWKNVNEQTGGITRLTISSEQGKVAIHPWGRCHPSDCDIGESEAFAYGPNINSLAKTALALTAQFDRGALHLILLVRPAAEGRLRVEEFHRFADATGRSNYTVSEEFAPAQ